MDAILWVVALNGLALLLVIFLIRLPRRSVIEHRISDARIRISDAKICEQCGALRLPTDQPTRGIR
jgi:hypothetical protein